MYNIAMDKMDQYQLPSVIEGVRAAFGGAMPVKDPTQLGPLVLAYVGDTVFDLYVRTRLILTTDLTAHGLHMLAAKRVCAAAQAESFRKVEPLLTEDELAVYRRGRNSHIGTVPKNASIADYRSATGLEAVIGWLYLKGRDDRLTLIMNTILNKQE